MARNKAKPEDFDDIADEAMPEGGFANIPLPDQRLIDQAAAGLPQLSPEEMAAQPRRPVRAVPAARQTQQGHRPMKQILDEFLAAIDGHPDCNMLSSVFNGKPAAGVAFQGTPAINQRTVELRLVWRDPRPEVVAAEEARAASAFAPGGKYFDLIERRGEQVAVPAQQPAAPPTAWGHLVKQRETAEAV